MSSQSQGICYCLNPNIRRWHWPSFHICLHFKKKNTRTEKSPEAGSVVTLLNKLSRTFFVRRNNSVLSKFRGSHVHKNLISRSVCMVYEHEQWGHCVQGQYELNVLPPCLPHPHSPPAFYCFFCPYWIVSLSLYSLRGDKAVRGCQHMFSGVLGGTKTR